ncbi:hypothetical protein MA04_01941 [Alcanivorax balearicus MACL04]|uniref:Ankyrin repeat domain-containing protein n=2 Tax=Alloalcanivorax balearicus TaxID=413232 RepID=A0ABT2QYN6_9GAMM|nr:hypothetical protein [Alloalcanivorax balearicus MACL04]
MPFVLGEVEENIFMKIGVLVIVLFLCESAFGQDLCLSVESRYWPIADDYKVMKRVVGLMEMTGIKDPYDDEWKELQVQNPYLVHSVASYFIDPYFLSVEGGREKLDFLFDLGVDIQDRDVAGRLIIMEFVSTRNRKFVDYAIDRYKKENVKIPIGDLKVILGCYGFEGSLVDED